MISDVGMIISYGLPATTAAISQQSPIPILYLGVHDSQSPVKGPNATGLRHDLPLSKLLDYAREIMDIKKMAVIFSSEEEDSRRQMEELAGLAGRHQIDMAEFDLNTTGDLKKLDDLNSNDAVFITGSIFAHIWLKNMLTSAQNKNIPTFDVFPDSMEQGITIAVYQNPDQLGRKAAEFAQRIIAGERAGTIKPEVLNGTELVINLTQTEKLGLTIPVRLLGEATGVK
jgi:putative tryptophan/tyrosine transport system substrate-binding protein